MKKQLKLSVLALTLLGAVTTPAFAQTADTANPNQTLNLGQANAFDKEVTPLLREMSLKKSLLELRKVERELEKLDEDALKAQIERENLLNPADKNLGVPAGPMGGIPLSSIPTSIGGMGMGGNPSIPPSMPTDPTEAVYENTIKILMIYGFTDSLFAKVSTGEQGGFVVTEGDILPDGRLVKKITPNFVEVYKDKNAADKKNKSRLKTEKLFVSYTPAPERRSSNVGGNSGTQNAGKPTHLLPIPAPAPILTPLK